MRRRQHKGSSQKPTTASIVMEPRNDRKLTSQAVHWLGKHIQMTGTTAAAHALDQVTPPFSIHAVEAVDIQATCSPLR